MRKGSPEHPKSTCFGYKGVPHDDGDDDDDDDDDDVAKNC